PPRRPIRGRWRGTRRRRGRTPVPPPRRTRRRHPRWGSGFVGGSTRGMRAPDPKGRPPTRGARPPYSTLTVDARKLHEAIRRVSGGAAFVVSRDRAVEAAHLRKGPS